MNKTAISTISEREFEIINVISAGLSSNQRALSSRTGMSLGLTNLLLRRMVIKGYLKIRQLNQRKLEYFLTPKGFKEKARKSYRYTLKTISSLILIREKIQLMFKGFLENGSTKFYLLGRGDLQDLVELAVRGLHDPRIELIRTLSYSANTSTRTEVVLHTGMEGFISNGHTKIDLVKALSDIALPHSSESHFENEIVDLNRSKL